MFTVILVAFPILSVSSTDVSVKVVVVRDIFIVDGFASAMSTVVVFKA
jgi:hypothetical protein